MKSNEPKPIYIDTMIAELGKYLDYNIILNNPSDEDVAVVCKRSNISQFMVLPQSIFIPAYMSQEIIIRYTPSQLEHPEDCNIKFITEQIGTWEYFFKGKGILPDKMEKTIVSSFVDGSASGIIAFKNPFNNPISIYIELKTDHKNAFRLVHHHQKKKPLSL